MAWIPLLLSLWSFVSGVNAEFCRSYQTPVINVCKASQIFGNRLFVENREIPDGAVTCSCALDVEGEAGKFTTTIGYSGPNRASCGILFRLYNTNTTFSCYDNTVNNAGHFQRIEFSKTINANSAYACLSVTLETGKNGTITCQNLTKTESVGNVTTTTTTTATTKMPTTTTTEKATTKTPATTSTIKIPASLSSKRPVSTMISISEAGTSSLSPELTSGAPGEVGPDRRVDQTTIIGIAAGAGVAVLLISVIVIVVCYVRRQKSGVQKDVITENDMYGVERPDTNTNTYPGGVPLYVNKAFMHAVSGGGIPCVLHTVSDSSDDADQYTSIDKNPPVSEVGERVTEENRDTQQNLSNMYAVVSKP